jgi:hypothetical protein
MTPQEACRAIAFDWTQFLEPASATDRAIKRLRESTGE